MGILTRIKELICAWVCNCKKSANQELTTHKPASQIVPNAHTKWFDREPLPAIVGGYVRTADTLQVGNDSRPVFEDPQTKIRFVLLAHGLFLRLHNGQLRPLRRLRQT